MSYPGKRALDLLVAVPGLILTAPVQLVAAAAVRLTMGSPVLFRQQRPGLHGEPFTMVKFRTMVPAERSGGGPIDDASRLTTVGRLLRTTSIDELPTLFNVIRGEMSIVGPRPLLMEYLHEYTEHQARRHDVRPGVTGLAQIRGRNRLEWEDRFRLDVQYVDTQRLSLDCRILAKTVLRVLKRDGISAPGNATMPAYRRRTG